MAITAAAGFIMVKSEPSAAKEEQSILSAKFSVIEEGEQGSWGTVPIAIGGCVAILKSAFDPAGTLRLHCPVSVLPSVPVAMAML